MFAACSGVAKRTCSQADRTGSGPAGAKFDAANVAFAADITDKVNTPGTGSDALGWLRTFSDVDGITQFHWAHKAKDSTGATPGPGVKIFTSHLDRLAKGYHEVSFQYQLARFCRKQSQNQGGCFGYIGGAQPKSYKAVGLRTWIGYLPVYDAKGAVVTPGKGLCGLPFLTGTTSDKLNPLVHDLANKAYRSAGMFQTVSQDNPGTDGEYDEGAVVDRNSHFPVCQSVPST